mmetsp:Transcript_107161/g.301606  ORF Transcript_107161/g.301606 Transcript_107161/m.301606 type:complete len:221 (-) Transcript_107161:3-665(-)
MPLWARPPTTSQVTAATSVRMDFHSEEPRTVRTSQRNLCSQKTANAGSKVSSCHDEKRTSCRAIPASSTSASTCAVAFQRPTAAAAAPPMKAWTWSPPPRRIRAPYAALAKIAAAATFGRKPTAEMLSIASASPARFPWSSTAWRPMALSAETSSKASSCKSYLPMCTEHKRNGTLGSAMMLRTSLTERLPRCVTTRARSISRASMSAAMDAAGKRTNVS